MNHDVIKKIEEEPRIAENSLFFAVYDKFPVNEGHVTIFAKAERRENWFDLDDHEIESLQTLTHQVKRLLEEKYTIDGYNLGMNCGEAAGQTVPRFHLHLIPRYKGDVENPKGGIRNFKKALVEY